MNEKEIFHGHVFDVVQKEMVIENRNVIRDIVIHHGGAALSCVQDGKILLVTQTRAAVNEKTLEIPAGTIDPGEDPKTTALRELNEETGYQCDSISLITAFWPTPGYDTEVIYVYECRGLHPAKERLSLDEGEDISVLWLPLEEAYEMIASGRIRDGKTIIAIYHAMLSLKRPG